MRILLIDPSRTALKFVTRLLEAADHEVRSFTNEIQGLDCLAQDPQIDALLTSVELGDSMSGLELCWRARLVAGERRPLYIIVMSSTYERGQLVEALDSGADDFIGKPPAADELYARLRTAARLTSMQRDLIQLASTDPLTGAFNRRAFFHTSEEICRVATEIGTAVSAIMLDLDHFKLINDVHGHDIGDAVLKGVAQEIAHVDDAVFGRLGGEEFALVLDQCALDEAEEISEGLRGVIAALRFPSPKGDVSLTCSFGVASFRAGDTVDTMLKRADLALYEAKAAGRNRVVVSTETGVVDFERPGGVLRSGTRPDGAMDAAE